MFENAELGHRLDKEAFKQAEPALRTALLDAQRQLAGADFSVLLVVAGMPTAGKSEVVNRLLSWLDARGVQVHAARDLTDEERQRPAMYRYWRDLPPRGRLAVFFESWGTSPMTEVLFGRLSRAQLDQGLDQYIAFERMLTHENTLLVKVWLHLSRQALKRRLKELKRDPAQSWRLTPLDRKLYRRYEAYRALGEHMIRRTDTAEAPWTILDASDPRFRDLTVGQALLGRLQARLEQSRQAPPRPAPAPVALVLPALNVLSALDLTFALDEATYEKEMAQALPRLARLTRRLRRRGRSAVLVFEGPDAAGKGGVIRRLTQAMDARDYRVISVAAPTDEERAHPYLWRFWRHLPRHGRVVIYDRSWYGRVLVERIEGFATPDEWMRAYGEINDFEQQLTAAGVILVKFWLAVSPGEQLRRFEQRQMTPYKQYKLTPEDWRNREKWTAYEAAACEMIERTSTSQAPWALVEADNKEHARVKVARAVVDRLEAALR